MQVVIDFETRSPVNLKKQGDFVYAAHPDTELMCLSIAVDADKPVLWIADKFRRLINPANIHFPIVSDIQARDVILRADRVIAHNSMFEFVLWRKIAQERMGWRPLKLSKMYDTMAQCAYHALPLKLDTAAHALNLPIKKDAKGHAVMLKLCKPRVPRKDERKLNPNWESTIYWHEDPEDLEALFNYCGTDSDVERLLAAKLAPLPPYERRIWLLDQVINLRGVCVDLPGARSIVNAVEARESKQLARFQALTRGVVSGPRSYVALKDWVNKETGLAVSSVNKEATKELLKKDLPAHVEEALSIKAELSKASVAKFNAMLLRSSEDSRLRGMTQYHGAGTGRWAGRGVQVHNLPRDSYQGADLRAVLDYFRRGDLDGLAILYDALYFAASRCVRGSFKAAPGKELLCADFSAIEGRGLAHLAGEEWVLQAYRDGKDMYKMAASVNLRKPYEEITKAERQNPGKISELACGYGGGPGAVRNFGGGVGMTDEDIYADIVTPWREARPNIVRFWGGIEYAAWRAIETPGQIFSFRSIDFTVHDNFLKCRLPSGRIMHYYKPDLREVVTPWKTLKVQITYEAMKVVDGKTTAQWARVSTRGPKLVENIVQAFCRDLLAEAMLRLAAAGYPIVMHVHDEAVAEVLKGTADLEEFERIMSIVPAWAKGMPIKAEGWVGQRYRK